MRSCLVFALYAMRAFSKITLKLEDDDAVVAGFLELEAGD